MKKYLSFLILSISFALFAEASDYVAGEMLVQFQNELRGLINISQQDGIALTGILAIDELNRQWQVTEIKKVIPDPNPDEIAQRMGLDMLYHFTFPKTTNIDQIMAAYEASSNVKYACPNAIYQVDRIPNDPRYSDAWHLPNIGCPDAWEASTGDPNVITAIVDMGVDYTHEDAQDKLWINPAEDINHNGRFDPSPEPAGDFNGVDEDNNGYVDDVIGYDFHYYDPDPMPNNNSEDHGMHCFGIATAGTDNNIGVASVGWNVRGMALKCGDNSGIYLNAAIGAIYYAADNGAWVISMSYGSYRGQHVAESTALAYAWERGCVEVGSAGNDNVQTPHYPSSYSWVISVAASNAADAKADFSNYGSTIDVCAPGVHILSTIISNNYAYYDGTSMAGPVVAGVAALMKSAFPSMTNAECTTAIYKTCDSMPDPLYNQGLLGHGRVNVAKAILQPIRSNLKITDFRINDQTGNNNGIPDPGETVALIITLTNETGWQNANSVSAIMNNDDQEIEVIKNSATFPAIPAGGSANCSADSFVFRVSASSPPYRARFDINLNANPQTLYPYDNLYIVIGSPRVILVDDDDGADIENWYEAACDSLGVIYRLWSVTDLGSPLTDTLNHYPVVVWFTGLDSVQTLTSTDMTNLSSYLDNGGNLFLCGQNLGQEIGTESFYSNYLHTSYLSNQISTGTFPKIVGIDGDPIGQSESDTLVLLGTGGAGNARSMDGIAPMSGAAGCHHYANNPDSIYSGIHYAGNYKVVYFGFPFEAIDANPTRYTQKWEILQRILLFFNEQLPGIEEKSVLINSSSLAICPNPFTSQTVIRFSSSKLNSSAKISLFDTNGRLINHWSVTSLKNSVTWNGKDRQGRPLPTGIYFCVMESKSEPWTTLNKIIYLK